MSESCRMPDSERAGQPLARGCAGGGTAAGAAATNAAQLLGAPALCFRRRFNMTFNTARAHSSFLITAVIFSLLLRLPRGQPLLWVALIFDAALMIFDMAWRWRCRGAPDGGSHARHREALLPLTAMSDIIMSRCMIGRLVLDNFSVAQPGVLGTLRHIITLVVASRILTNAIVWSQWYRVFWAFPAHIAIVANFIKTNHITSQSTALAGGPVALQATRGVAQVLRLLRFNGLAPPPPDGLTPLQECCSVLAYLQLSVGLVLPAVVMAVHEIRLFLAHAAERRRAGLPPERGWHPWLYRKIGDTLLGLDWLFVAVLAWVLLGVLGSLAEALSLGTPAPVHA
ncbi:hypothetical protein ABPG75_010596 [Micractinium tetrahymenae]